MRRSMWAILMFIFALTLLVAGCSGEEEPTPTVDTPTIEAADTPTPAPPTPTPLTEAQFNLARVDSLEVVSTDGEPAEYGVRLRGAVSNGCSRVDDIVTEIEGDVFTIAVLQVQDPPEPDQDCTEEELPFDMTVDLIDVAPGSYTVKAHGLQGTFTIEDVAATDQEPGTGAISGTVWHDLCVGTGGEETLPPPGCTADNQGALVANGLLEDEPGIADVRVGLAAGSCSSPATEFTVTDADGDYSFDELPLGAYCVSIDEQNEQNATVLLDGAWTSPDGGPAEQLVDLDTESEAQGINFGWDFAFLPLAEFDPETCDNSFAYLEDLSVPDDTELAPNQAFTKRWLLQNNGTCPWSEAYSIVFVSGDQMSGPDTMPLARQIVPGQRLEIAVDMIAPPETGSYRGNWQLADANGEPFGIDGFVEDAFWVRIVVSENVTPGAATQTPASGPGTIGGVVWDDFCLNSDPGTGCVEFPEGTGIYVADGSFGASESALVGITISLATQSCPTDGTLPPASRVIAQAVTDEDGLYRFTDLDTGMYCIFMDALSDENVDLLIPGNWTWPATGVGRYTFFLDPGEQALDRDFGWDYVD